MNFKQSKRKIPLNKGWSNDKKFILKTNDEIVLLRILNQTQFNRKIQELNYLSALDLLPLQFSRPLSVEWVKDKIHFITSFIEGEDLSDLIEKMPYSKQIELGHQAGRALKLIHTQIKIETNDWETRYSAKVKRKLEAYRSCGVSFDQDEVLINQLIHLMPMIHDRPMCFQHGDYHIGNFVLDTDGNLGILDFDRWDEGDPWEEFNRIVWSREKSPCFASAMIDDYFDFKVPDGFFDLMFLYIGVNALSSIPWAIKIGEAELDVMMHLMDQFRQDTLNFTQVKPTWYQNTLE